MALEEIKELVESKNVTIQDLEKKGNYLEKLSEIKNYQVLESLRGVGFSEKGTHSLSETLKIVKENPNENYHIIPVK
ncbi:MAG: hypothetical protein NTZ83_05640 [Candidatus Pacearchaeota archaeon]|nr:hypothetical protein [Candidatus Pacearchaeota archaeon]